MAIAPVTVGNLDVYLDALGTVTPVYTVTVVSRVAGEITEIRFKEGQIVKKNDLLAVIDPRPYVAALIQAQGQLARDQALLKNAHIDLGRYQNAYQDHAIPQQQLATQEATVDQDQATVKLDQGNLEAVKMLLAHHAAITPDVRNMVTCCGDRELITYLEDSSGIPANRPLTKMSPTNGIMCNRPKMIAKTMSTTTKPSG